MMTVVIVLLGCLILSAIIGVVVITRLICICGPNEVLIFSGGQRATDGGEVGYRLVQGGRGIRIPLFERVDRMDLTNMIINIQSTGAYAKGGIPLNIEGVANLKIASTEPVIGNAIERFLGKPRQEVIRVARETLEGNMRGVLATLTPEEVNQDRVKFAQELLSEADKDLRNLGLRLDTLKIQNVSDAKGYLDSLGRKQSATLLMHSRIAEAENQTIAAERSAENFQTEEVARVKADIAKAQARARQMVVDARTQKEALVAEQVGQVHALVTKASAELEVEKARVEQVRLKLIADQIKPAEAALQQRTEVARGNAAKVLEDGKATAVAIRELADTWNNNSAAAREILLSQKLAPLVRTIMGTIDSMPIDNVTIIDSSIAQGGNGLAAKAATTNAQLKQAVGVDLAEIVNRLTAGRSQVDSSDAAE